MSQETWVAAIRQSGVLLWSSLGSCLYCTRTAFRAALAAWGLAACARAMRLGEIDALIGIAACAMTALWLAHLLAHAVKASGRQSALQPRPGGASRRDLMPLFVRALVVTAAITSIPRLALGQCGEAGPARCQSAHTDCHSDCDRMFHRDERNHACHQECTSNFAACNAEAGCS